MRHLSLGPEYWVFMAATGRCHVTCSEGKACISIVEFSRDPLDFIFTPAVGSNAAGAVLIFVCFDLL